MHQRRGGLPSRLQRSLVVGLAMAGAAGLLGGGQVQSLAAAEEPTLKLATDLTKTPRMAATASSAPAPIAAPATPTADGAQPGWTVAGKIPVHPLPRDRGGFVRAAGTGLLLNGAQWRFVGYNDFRLTSSDTGFQCGGPLSAADVGDALDEIRAQSGATVVRTWFMQSYGGPGNWSQFDRVLSAAAARGMKIIPVLGDQWAACEPWPAGEARYRTRAWYDGGYRQPDFGYSFSYRDFAAAMGTHYRTSTTIAFWQLMNEAEAADHAGGACDDAAANAAIHRFAEDVAGLLKSLDPNHLVSLGTIGTGQCGTSSHDDFLTLHAGNIDICEYHDYFGAGAVPGDQWHGVATRIDECHSLNKPIFAGEVGLQASISLDGSTAGPVTANSLALRAADMDAKLQGQFAMGIAGFLVWQYAAGTRTDNFEVQPGDPLEAVMARAAAAL